ncbi:importin-9 isoform X3 [Malaclemys terrapin pileata]|uniref:importin-9 isoform X3 n=1 Tax=Malaclemys terrapin pileata TaxID=2991368 RepID=UPI0023A7F270|nr:importin-9 isoform X3 [Malaclemys terrapin pileata]
MQFPAGLRGRCARLPSSLGGAACRRCVTCVRLARAAARTVETAGRSGGGMAGAGLVAQGLKEALVETLTGILCPVQGVRAAAEEQVKVLEVTEEFGVHLAELTVDPQGVLAIRQSELIHCEGHDSVLILSPDTALLICYRSAETMLASVILKQYVETHWCSQSDKFRHPETTERAKVAIRELLPNGLRESISKVRSSVAYAVSAIAHWDWPEAWPQLFNLLMEMLVSGDLNAVHGAMRVLTEFTREVTDTQMPLVAPVILPEMYKIFTMAEVYGIRTRSRAVEIFTTCAHMICNMEELEKGAAKVLIFPVVQQFTEAFVQALQMPDGPTSDSGFKMEVLKAVTALVKNYPKHMVSSMQQILPIVWNTLTESAAFYVRTEVNYTEEVEDPVDSDGEVLGFENLVFSIFEFVHALLENHKFKSTVKKALPELIYYIILYMQITEEQIKVWTANPQQFVEDEDDDTFSYTVRIAAQDLLLAVAADFQNESATALAAAATRHLQEAEQAKNSGAEHWWKIHEACMLALGSVKSVITDSVKNGRIHFDMHGFLTNVVLADLNLSVSPFLLGRALWAASRFTVAMSPELIQQFLQATVSGLHETQPPSVRISAVRAIWGYCDQLKISESTHVLQPFLPSILDGLIHLAAQFSSEVLNLVMETLCIVCTVDPAFTANVENKICPFTIAIFLKYSNDPVVASLAQDIFKELAQIEACQGPMQMRLIPTLVSIMQAPADKIPAGLCASLIMVFAHLVHSQLEPLLEFLSSLPGPTGKPALEFVMAEWMSRQHLFYGQYEGKVSSVALCKLLQYGINSDDKRLQDIRVKGEEIFNMEEGIRTRSKSAKNPERWTNIPLLIKILKLIINELSNAMEANASRQTAADWSQDDSNDMWEDREDEEDEDEGLAGQLLSDILATNKYDEDYYDDEEDDPDALKDPLYQIDLQAYLTDFLCQFAQQPCYAMFSDHLNENERRVLEAIGI